MQKFKLDERKPPEEGRRLLVAFDGEKDVFHQIVKYCKGEFVDVHGNSMEWLEFPAYWWYAPTL